MKKNVFKVGVASLAVTAAIASTAVTDVFAAKPTQTQNIEWNNKIVERVLEQLNLIQEKNGFKYSPLLSTEQFKLLIEGKFASIGKITLPVEKPATKPVVTKPTPEVTKPAEKPVTTPEVTKPAEKPVTTPEVTKPVEKPVTTPEVTKPAEKPVTTPEVTKPAETPVTTPEQKPVVTEEKTEQTENSQFSAEQQEVLALVNKERTSRGLKALVLDAAVSKVATEKARDMQDNNYFSHQSPTYGSPFDMLTQFGVKYTYAGENIAYGQRSPEEVMTAWMNSTGHRENILNANYTKLGVGYVGNKWVQMFIAN